MNDLYHYVGNDILASPTGDLQPVDSTVKGQQRILRRLLTNPGTYIWHPEYGAGLASYIGALIDVPKIRALIRGQMLLEDAVAKTPEPVIDLQAIPEGLSAQIQYVDAATQTMQTLSFSVTQ